MIRVLRSAAILALLCALASGAGFLAPAVAQDTKAKPADPKAAQAKKPDPKKADAKKPDPKKPDSKAAKASDPKGKDAKKPDAKPAAAASAAPVKPVPIDKVNDWGIYVAGAGKAKTCYALAEPKDRLPKTLKRDPGYVFISSRPGEGVRNEVSIVMGFDVKADSTPMAEIGAAKFEMIAKGANLWVKNAAQETQFVDALRKGSRLVVKAESKKGNATSDAYVLTGLGTALDRVTKECQ